MDEAFEWLTTGAAEFGLELDAAKLEQFDLYLRWLQEWNKKINLTSITAPPEVVVKHYLDSLTVARLITGPAGKLIDIGTGAGFPGIPLKLVLPELRLTLLDATAKKIEFLRQLCQALEIEVQLVNARAEEAGRDPKHREAYDYAVSRAVADMIPLAEYALPLVRTGGLVIAMKSSDVEEELNEARYAIGLLGGAVDTIVEVALPHSDIRRKLIAIRKIKATPAAYPRKPGMPQKKPLKQ